MADEYKENGATSIISMLGSIVAALGFEITDNAKAAVTMLKMQRDLMLDSTMKDYLTGQYTIKTLQNITNGAWYVPGKLVSWVQKWLASDEGGGYPTSGTAFNIKSGDILEYQGVQGNSTLAKYVSEIEKLATKKIGTSVKLIELFGRNYSNYFQGTAVLATDETTVTALKDMTAKPYGNYYQYGPPTGIKVTNVYDSSTIVIDPTGIINPNDVTFKFNPSTGMSNSDGYFTGFDIPYYWAFSLLTYYKIGGFNAGGGITRGGGVGRHSLPKEENFPPCGGDTTVPSITEWGGKVINWNGGCYLPLTYYKVNQSNENPGTEPGSPSTPISPEDPRLDPDSPSYNPSIPEDILKYIYPNNTSQDIPQNGENPVQTSGQLKDNFTNATNGPSYIPSTDIKGGLYTLWHPSADNLQNLGAFLYGATTQGAIASIIGDPINAIIQLTEWAVKPVDGPVKTPVICNIAATDLKMPTITNQFMQFDCGTIEIPREYHDFRDYEPYTRLSLFLPFVGDVNISTNDCITPHKIHVIYNIDFLSGVACAEVLVDEDVRYAYQAAMCAVIPVTSGDASRLLASLIGAAVGAVGGSVMGGIVGGTAGSRLAAHSLISGVSEAALAPINGIQTQRTGSISANTGLLGEMKPYVLVTRPISVVSDQYKSLLGQPYQLDGTLGSQTGFVKVREVHLDGITATESEKQEIEQLLKKGVIL